MSVERVIQDVEILVKEKKINVLLIEDDHFLSNKARAKEILNKLRRFNIRLEFPNGLAVYAIDKEIAYLLKEAGTVTATLAVESGSDFVLKDVINKPLKVEMVYNAVKYLRENKINVHGFFVLGIPGEREEHRQETLNLMKNAGFDWVYPFIAIPIAGSRLYEECKKKKYLVNEDFRNCVMSKGNIKTVEIDPYLLEQEVYSMNLEVNFVNNFNYRQKDYNKAISYFKPITERYKMHAFAHYFLSKAYEQLSTFSKEAQFHYGEFLKIIKDNQEWHGYAKKFNLI